MRIDVHKNLNRKNKPHQWTVIHKGKVVGYARYIRITGASFTSCRLNNGKPTQKLEDTKIKRAVFAMVRGDHADLITERIEEFKGIKQIYRDDQPVDLTGYRQITVNPYRDVDLPNWGRFFYCDTGEYVDHSLYTIKNSPYTVVFDDKWRCWIKREKA